MISKINQIKKFGCFDHFEWNDLKPFSSTNILYGYNGSGKTTLSNLFYLFSAECKNRNDLAKEYLINDSEFQIQIGNDILSEKNFETYSNSPIYVFNTRFISDHIFDGSKSNMSSFSSESAGITNEIIDEIDEKIKILITRNNQLINWKNQLTQKLEHIWNAQKRDFNSKITGKRLTDSPAITDASSNNIDEERNKLEKLYNDSDKINKIEILVETLSLIKEKVHNLSICEIEKDNLKQLLNIPINVDSIEKIKSHIKEVLYKFSDKNININKWLIDGNSLLKSNKKNKILTCPLCQSNIGKIIEELISGYDSHFNENIKELFRQLENYENTLKNIPTQIQEQKVLLNDLSVLLEQFNTSIQNKIPENQVNLRSNIKKIKKSINDKRISPNASVDIPDLLFIDIADFNNAIIEIKKEINGCVEVLEKEIDILKQKDIIGEIKKKAKEISIAEYNDKSNSIFPNSNKTNAEIAKKITVLIKETEKIKNGNYIQFYIDVFVIV